MLYPGGLCILYRYHVESMCTQRKEIVDDTPILQVRRKGLGAGTDVRLKGGR